MYVHVGTGRPVLIARGVHVHVHVHTHVHVGSQNFVSNTCLVLVCEGRDVAVFLTTQWIVKLSINLQRKHVYACYMHVCVSTCTCTMYLRMIFMCTLI